MPAELMQGLTACLLERATRKPRSQPVPCRACCAAPGTVPHLQHVGSTPGQTRAGQGCGRGLCRADSKQHGAFPATLGARARTPVRIEQQLAAQTGALPRAPGPAARVGMLLESPRAAEGLPY